MYGLKLRSRPTILLAYKNLSQTQFSLNSALQRLSSGLSINKAADNSASPSLSIRMNSQTKSVKQANRNTQDTYNLSATAEPSLSDHGTILSKIRELSVQVSTERLNNMDRASIDLEFQSLKDELTRIATTAIDHAIDEVNRKRSHIIRLEQNKLQFTMSNLTNRTQNIEAAHSSIQDTNFAADAADLAKNQIPAQSATARLAQTSAILQNITVINRRLISN